jgi:hypothetical protein
MLSQSLRQGFLALSLLTLCLTPAVAEARTHAVGKPAPAAVTAPAQESVLQTLWRGVAHLLQKEGASIDPSGRPTTTSSLAGSGDEGASIDPSGLHHN